MELRSGTMIGFVTRAKSGVAGLWLFEGMRADGVLTALDGDILQAQSQLLLLREEIDLQATQRTDRNLYVLSIVTILTMPPMRTIQSITLTYSAKPPPEGSNPAVQPTFL